jgi:hypothetical protein
MVMYPDVPGSLILTLMPKVINLCELNSSSLGNAYLLLQRVQNQVQKKCLVEQYNPEITGFPVVVAFTYALVKI